MITDEMKADGWIEHDGGPMPVNGDAIVQIKLVGADGDVWNRGGADDASWFDSLDWWEGSKRWRITAYHLRVKP